MDHQKGAVAITIFIVVATASFLLSLGLILPSLLLLFSPDLLLDILFRPCLLAASDFFIYYLLLLPLQGIHMHSQFPLLYFPMQFIDVLSYGHQDTFCSYVLSPSTHISFEPSVLLHLSKASFYLDASIHSHKFAFFSCDPL